MRRAPWASSRFRSLNCASAGSTNHEHVRRSSVHTIRRYRSATEHLLEFVRDVRPLGRASDFRSQHAEEFVRYLRSKKVAPNGHKKARKRCLRDAGVRYILETCCSLFNYAGKASTPASLCREPDPRDRSQSNAG